MNPMMRGKQRRYILGRWWRKLRWRWISIIKARRRNYGGRKEKGFQEKSVKVSAIWESGQIGREKRRWEGVRRGVIEGESCGWKKIVTCLDKYIHSAGRNMRAHHWGFCFFDWWLRETLVLFFLIGGLTDQNVIHDIFDLQGDCKNS